MENNEEKRHGQGIFLGVIGVATLVVAIIGATFAYFSASASSNADAITTNSTALSLSKGMDATGLKGDLIPAYDNIAEAGYEKTTDQCIDDNSNNICSVYKFAVGNPSETTAQKVYGSLIVSTNTFNNLYFRMYDVTSGTPVEVVMPTKIEKGTSTIDLTTIDVDDALEPTLLATPTGSDYSSATDALTGYTLGTGNKKIYEIVLWLHETGSNQSAGDNIDDTNKSFAAGISFTTEKNGSGVGVTGVISGVTGTNYEPSSSSSN